MKFIDAYKQATKWQRRITLISLYHNAKLNKNKKWQMKDTAKYFQISIALVSESLTLSKRWDEVKDLPSRNQALKKLK